MELETPTASSTAASSSCVSREEFNKSGKQGEIYVLYIYIYIYIYIFIFREREREIQRQRMAVVDPSCAFIHGVPVPVPARNDALKHPRTSKCIAQGQLAILLPGMWWHVMVRYLLRYWIHAKRIHEALDLTWSDMIIMIWYGIFMWQRQVQLRGWSGMLQEISPEGSQHMSWKNSGSQKFTRHTDVYSASCFITATYGIIATE